MIYDYKCPNCNKQTIIEKPISECNREEHCEVCQSVLKRVYQSPSVKTSDGVKK